MPQTAIVLAGGFGTRLRQAVSGQPKVLAPAAGRPFLDYLMAYLARQGICHVILSTGYLAEQIRAFAGDGSRWGFEVTYSEEREPLGTGGALRLASETLDSERFFALNGDTLFQVDLSRLWKAHHKFQCAATLALRRVRCAEWLERGFVTLAKDGRILSFDEKPGSIQGTSPERFALDRSPLQGTAPHTVLMNGGVYVLEKAALYSVRLGTKASLELDVFPRLAQSGQISGIVQEGYFTDIGTPESLETFEHDIRRGIIKFERALSPKNEGKPPEKRAQS